MKQVCRCLGTGYPDARVRFGAASRTVIGSIRHPRAFRRCSGETWQLIDAALERARSRSFSFPVAEKALKQDLLPGTISSDVHQFNVHGPVFDLATTLSKFLLLGLTLEQVIERATTNPARLFGFPQGLGTLREGAEADIAVFALAEGDFTFVDAHVQKRHGHRKLIPAATVKAGRLYGSASFPVPESKGR